MYAPNATVDGPTLFLLYRSLASIALIFWFLALAAAYIHPKATRGLLGPCEKQRWAHAIWRGAFAAGLGYGLDHFWIANNPYDALSGPPGATFGIAIDLILIAGLVSTLVSAMLLFGRLRAYVCFVAWALVASPLSEERAFFAFFAAPLVLLSLVVNRRLVPDSGGQVSRSN